MRKGKHDTIPGVYNYTKTADPFSLEAEALLLDGEEEEQRALCPPYPKMTMEAIKQIVKTFGVGDDPSEESTNLRERLEAEELIRKNLSINEIFTDRNFESRLGMEAINSPPGLIHKYGQFTEDEDKVLEYVQKLNRDRKPIKSKYITCLIKGQVITMFPAIKFDEQQSNSNDEGSMFPR